MIGRPSAATTASFAPSNDVDLEDTPDRMRAMGRAAVERSITHIAAMPNDSRSGNLDAAALCRASREGVPEHASDFEALTTCCSVS
ncbi:MAG: hypothetical protein ABI910_18695 [Gemmatimonadota bacterium]